VRTSKIILPAAAIAAALWLGAVSAAPSVALATAGVSGDRAPHQYYWPSSSGYYGRNGYGGYYSAYPYSGSGSAAWYGSGYYPGSYWNGNYSPGAYWDGSYYPGASWNWSGNDSGPYEGSPGYPYYNYGSHYGYGQPAYVNPGYSPWAPGY
jgi:hypothetical protein